MTAKVFDFKQFSVRREHAGMKLSTDSVLLGAWTADYLIRRSRDKDLQQSSYPDRPVEHILDIGTGTGVLAMIMAQFFRTASVTAVDIDAGAVADAVINFRECPFSSRIVLCQTDISAVCSNRELMEKSVYGRTDMDPDKRYDLIICNPPYYDSAVGVRSESRRQARCNDSLSSFRLFKAVDNFLSADGYACIILPVSQSSGYLEEADAQGFVAEKTVKISSRADKEPYAVLLAIRRKEAVRGINGNIGKNGICEDTGDDSSLFKMTAVSSEEQYLTEKDGRRSDFFAGITRDLYLR